MKILKIILTANIIIMPLIYCFSNNNSLNISKTDYYTLQWKKVDSLVNNGLTKSAIEIVKEIYYKSKKEDNTNQFLKSVIYKVKLNDEFDENQFSKSIKELEYEVKTSVNQTQKAILYSMLAEIYYRYYNKNSYNISERTILLDKEDTNIDLWDSKMFLEKISDLYLKSVNNDKLLKSINISEVDSIIIKNNDFRYLRPTLYDFLAHRALDFFKENIYQNNISDNFVFNNINFFASIKDFYEIDIKKPETLSLKYHAIKLFQELEKFHLNDIEPSALIDVAVERLLFVNENSALENSDTLYLKALTALESEFEKFDASADIIYQKAIYYYNLNDLSNSKKNKCYYKEAYSLCEKAISKYKYNFAVANCKNLLKQIEQKSFSLETEYINTPGKPCRMLVNYRNISELYFRIYKFDYDEYEKEFENLNDEDKINRLLTYKPVTEFQQNLPKTGDYQNHSVEIKIPELSTGYYCIIGGTDKGFSIKENAVSFLKFYASSIYFLNRRLPNDVNELYVFDNMSGKPLKDVKINIYNKKYYNEKISERNKKIKSFFTDENGCVKIKQDYQILNIYNTADIYRNNEDVVKGYRIYIRNENYYKQNEEKYIKTNFYTDRTIYKPGQIIYFKGIVVEINDNDNKIKPNYKTKITLFDVNYEKISEKEFITNEFGSFNGSFIIPKSCLTGKFLISNENGSCFFNVEEYKAPKFEIKINDIADSYKLNDSIEITGKAVSFTGSNICNANIKCRITRKDISFYNDYFFYDENNNNESEIFKNSTKTNENGDFKIKFKAISDILTFSETDAYNFIIKIDVTDINGETQSETKEIYIGKKPAFVNIDFKENVDKNENNCFKITSVNINKLNVNTKGLINIYKLKQPEKSFRERYWEKPDQHILSKEEFYKIFPYDLYDDENDFKKWSKDKNVFSLIFNSSKDSIIKLNDLKKYESGKYVYNIKAVTESGDSIVEEMYFNVFSYSDKKVSNNAINYFFIDKNTARVGDTIKIIFGSYENNIKALFEISTKDTTIDKRWINIDNEQKTIFLPIKEEYRGNININLHFVKNNRFYRNFEKISIPYDNKKLYFEFSTFRDKLQPGEKEEIRIKLKDNKDKTIRAEVLANLYDYSLDKIINHSWYIDFYNSYSNFFHFNNYEYDYFDETVKSELYGKIFLLNYSFINKNYDYLNWFGYDYYNRFSREEDDIDISLGVEKTVKYTPPIIVNKSISEGQGMVNIDDLNEKNVEPKSQIKTNNLKLRSNFNETALFYPNLVTDENGEVSFSFKMPDALTKWRLMTLSHTKDMKIGYVEKFITTQKKLMITPNKPRFITEGDKIVISTKIDNLTTETLNGIIKIELSDINNQIINNECLIKEKPEKDFIINSNSNNQVSWEIFVPKNYEAITFKIIATTDNYSDGEEFIIPIISKRILVNETFPFYLNGKQTKEFEIKRIGEATKSSTLENYRLTFEYVNSPYWYAVQALPYIGDINNECSESVFSKLYSNTLASYIANKHPKIKTIYNQWKEVQSNSLQSNLEKNEELKNIVLSESPWVSEAKNESEQKQNIALFFDENKMNNDIEYTLTKLLENQSVNGGWSWFPGMQDDWYITQYITEGLVKLKNLGIEKLPGGYRINNSIQNAILYLDNLVNKEYEYIIKNDKINIDKDHTSQIIIQYLYLKSFFNDIKAGNKESFDYFKNQTKKYWLSKNKYMQSLIALIHYRLGDKEFALKILKSLEENAIISDEMGMYWKDINYGPYWYESPIGAQSSIIQAFAEILPDSKNINLMKLWLIKQKQTQKWESSKSTAEACYALIFKGDDYLDDNTFPEINVGNEKIDFSSSEIGSGYYKKSWNKEQIKNESLRLKIIKNNDGTSWGAIYWQYFEDVNKIKSYNTNNLTVNKKIFLEKDSNKTKVLIPIRDKAQLKTGDKIKVRLEITSDRNYEYVHLKDMHASGLEYTEYLSGYDYKQGLGYYKSIKDASINYFFSYVPKGTYVLEYELKVNNNGEYTSGIATIQCYYSPEFNSHSSSVILKAE